MHKQFDVPYYAVIFKSKLAIADDSYGEMAKIMQLHVEEQSGFLGCDSVRNHEGIGITVSYWSNLESIKQWQYHVLHVQAKLLGKTKWYEDYTIRICKVENEETFCRDMND